MYMRNTKATFGTALYTKFIFQACIKDCRPENTVHIEQMYSKDKEIHIKSADINS